MATRSVFVQIDVDDDVDMHRASRNARSTILQPSQGSENKMTAGEPYPVKS